MNETNEGITFADIFKIIKSKLKAIVCVTLVLLILGAAVGALITPNKKYGTKLSFYVSDATLDKRMLELIASQSFGEKLLLDKNGLTGDPESAEYKAALEAKQKYEDMLSEKHEVARDIKILPSIINNANAINQEKANAYNDIASVLQAYLAANVDGTAENLIDKDKVAEYEKQLATLKTERDTASQQYSEALTSYQAALKRQLEIDNEIADLKKEADKTANVLLAPWRQNNDVKNDMKAISSSVKYSYSGEKDNSFITVEIEVDNNKELAEKIVSKMLLELPKYVVNNVTDDDPATIPQCEVSSTFNNVKLLESNGKLKAAIIYGGIAAVVAVVGMCVLVVLVDVVRQGSSNGKKDEQEAIEEKTE